MFVSRGVCVTQQLHAGGTFTRTEDIIPNGRGTCQE